FCSAGPVGVRAAPAAATRTAGLAVQIRYWLERLRRRDLRRPVESTPTCHRRRRPRPGPAPAALPLAGPLVASIQSHFLGTGRIGSACPWIIRGAIPVAPPHSCGAARVCLVCAEARPHAAEHAGRVSGPTRQRSEPDQPLNLLTICVSPPQPGLVNIQKGPRLAPAKRGQAFPRCARLDCVAQFLCRRHSYDSAAPAYPVLLAKCRGAGVAFVPPRRFAEQPSGSGAASRSSRVLQTAPLSRPVKHRPAQGGLWQSNYGVRLPPRLNMSDDTLPGRRPFVGCNHGLRATYAMPCPLASLTHPRRLAPVPPLTSSPPIYAFSGRRRPAAWGLMPRVGRLVVRSTYHNGGVSHSPTFSRIDRHAR